MSTIGRTMGWASGIAGALVMLVACGGESQSHVNAEARGNTCEAQSLPLAVAAEGPVLEELALLCEPNHVDIVAVAQDPQGDPDLDDVPQRLRVHRSPECDATTIELEDDFVGSGVEEAFGVVLEKAEEPELYTALCSAEAWPVEVELRDSTGNVTSGVALAEVVSDR